MRGIKRFAALFTAAVIAFSVLSITAVSSAGKISYDFKGDEKDKAGYAEGKITLSGVPGGKYKLYWADDKKALDGFYEITGLKSGESFTFSDHNAIPADATKVIAVSGSDLSVKNAAAVYDIPENKRLKYKSPDANYTFMNYSDIHIDCADNQYYKYSELHWKKALETAAKRKAEFIITAGDNITNAEGPGREFNKFQEILADSRFTGYVYEGSGNHELRRGEPEELLSTFISSTGLDGKEKTIASGLPYYTVTEPKSGDLFIFMALEYLYSPEKGDEFSKAQLDWLEKTLKENYGKNKNIYLIQHALIEGYGAGDDEDNYYTVPLDPRYKTTVRFRNIIQKYPELIWISGHTHIAFKYGYNYSNMSDTSCNMIHDSSVCCPTLLNYGSHSLSYAAASDEEYKDLTEGYYVQVFDDASVFYGENLYHDKIYPSACYIVEGCRKGENKVSADTAEKKTIFGASNDIGSLALAAFTVPKSLECKNINDSDIEGLCKMSKTLLNEMFTFSSYNDYADLKRAVKFAPLKKDKDKAYKQLSEAYLKVLSYSQRGNITVYFTNTNEWKNVYAKLFSAKLNNGKKGEKMTFVKKDIDGYGIYKIEVNYNKYNQVIFTDGSNEEKSETQTLSGENNKLYYLNNNDPYAPYYVYIRDYE